MKEESSWILKPIAYDLSFIRDYVGYNMVNQIDSMQSNLRYCEVILKKAGEYHYSGLYMLYESVDTLAKRANSGYVLKKGKSEHVLDTWATKQGLYNDKNLYFALAYPRSPDSKDIVQITDDISKIEKILYSNDKEELSRIEQYLNIDSFVDYFIINQFFGNCDAEYDSTYMYKTIDGKFKIGLYWNFDQAMDNNVQELFDFTSSTLPSFSWFENLIKIESFVNKVEKRYHELRKSVLSYESLCSLIDGAQGYLGNALLRNQSIYSFYNNLELLKEPQTGEIIDRRRYDVQSETQRVKDFIYEYGNFMDKHIEDLRSYIKYSGLSSDYNSLLGFGFIILVIVSIVLAQRYRYLK